MIIPSMKLIVSLFALFVYCVDCRCDSDSEELKETSLPFSADAPTAAETLLPSTNTPGSSTVNPLFRKALDTQPTEPDFGAAAVTTETDNAAPRMVSSKPSCKDSLYGDAEDVNTRRFGDDEGDSSSMSSMQTDTSPWSTLLDPGSTVGSLSTLLGASSTPFGLGSSTPPFGSSLPRSTLMGLTTPWGSDSTSPLFGGPMFRSGGTTPWSTLTPPTQAPTLATSFLSPTKSYPSMGGFPSLFKGGIIMRILKLLLLQFPKMLLHLLLLRVFAPSVFRSCRC